MGFTCMCEIWMIKPCESTNMKLGVYGVVFIQHIKLYHRQHWGPNPIGMLFVPLFWNPHTAWYTLGNTVHVNSSLCVYWFFTDVLVLLCNLLVYYCFFIELVMLFIGFLMHDIARILALQCNLCIIFGWYCYSKLFVLYCLPYWFCNVIWQVYKV